MPPRGHSGTPLADQAEVQGRGKVQWQRRYVVRMAAQVSGDDVHQSDVTLFHVLESAVESAVEATKAHVERISMGRPFQKSAVPYNRLIHLLCRLALVLHQPAAEEDGLEAWRLHRQRFDPNQRQR